MINYAYSNHRGYTYTYGISMEYARYMIVQYCTVCYYVPCYNYTYHTRDEGGRVGWLREGLGGNG